MSGKNLSPLRRSVGTIAAAAVGVAGVRPGITRRWKRVARGMIAPNHRVMTGLDVLEDQKFAPLAGKRVGLITNQTALTGAGRRT